MIGLMLLKWLIFLLALTFVLFFIPCFFLKMEPSGEMKSKFESGIDQSEQECPLLYMHFFYIGVLFLIFDVELILCVPMVQSVMTLNQWGLFWLVFFSVIFIGLVIEVMVDSVEWKE